MCERLLLSYVRGNQEPSSELAAGWTLKWGWLMASIPDLKCTVQSQGEEEGGAVSGVRPDHGGILGGPPTQAVRGSLLPPTPATLTAQLHASLQPVWKHDLYVAGHISAIRFSGSSSVSRAKALWIQNWKDELEQPEDVNGLGSFLCL